MAAPLVAIATETPTEVPGVQSGIWYSFQNQSPDAIVHVTTAASTPMRDAPAFRQRPGQVGTVKADAGDAIYIWTDRGRARVVYDVAE